MYPISRSRPSWPILHSYRGIRHILSWIILYPSVPRHDQNLLIPAKKLRPQWNLASAGLGDSPWSPFWPCWNVGSRQGLGHAPLSGMRLWWYSHHLKSSICWRLHSLFSWVMMVIWRIKILTKPLNQPNKNTWTTDWTLEEFEKYTPCRKKPGKMIELAV